MQGVKNSKNLKINYMIKPASKIKYKTFKIKHLNLFIEQYF